MDTTKNVPKDTFFYLLSIVTLVASAVSLGIIFFQLINLYFPDILMQYVPDKSQYLEPLRNALAGIIVFFPVYFWTARMIRKDILANPEKRDFKLRKWLLYLTLFVASIVIIGDLVTLVNNYLRGEITARFILKVVSVLFIAGSIFYYYYTQLREQPVQKEYAMGPFAWVVTLIIAATVVSGFVVAGSPQSQRLVRFDQRRVGDLQSIQWQVIDYWQRKRTLPPNLEALRDDISGYRAPTDPKSGQEYEYKVEAATKFSLCAIFETESAETNNVDRYYPKPMSPESSVVGPDGPDNWNHGVGRQCFARTIDPDRYPPITR